MKSAMLPERGVIKVAGDDARRFLNGLLTSDIEKVTPQRPCFAALLTPQGKIIVDCIVIEATAEDGGGFFLDCPRALAPDFVKKLNFYRLRAKASAEDLSEKLGVLAVWDGVAATEYGLVYADPRLAALGFRVILPPELAAEAAQDIGAELMDASAYDAHRIALGIPRGGMDFSYGDAFPHDADMDQLGGVDFAKGCYVGQEVVSRVEHRGSARARIVAVSFDGYMQGSGTDIVAGGKTVGTLGSVSAGRGVALVRLDRLQDALNAGTPITSGGTPLSIAKPDWGRFAFPVEAKPQ